MVFCPLVGTFSRLCCLFHKAGVVFLIRCEKACRISHHSRKVKRGGDTLCHHIARLLAVSRHDKTLEVWSGQFVIHTPIVRILHGEQPLQIEHHLIQEVGCLVATFGDVCLQFIEIVALLFISSKHQSNTEGRVDHILVVVTCIIPTVGRTDDSASRTFLCSRRGMHQHVGVRMPQRAIVYPTLFDGDA